MTDNKKFELDIDALIEDVKNSVIDLAEREAKDYIDQATADAIDFVKLVSNNLKNWAEAVVAGNLDTNELKFLLKGQKDLLVMHSLSQAGLAAARIQRIRDGIISILLDALSTAIFARPTDVVTPLVVSNMAPIGGEALITAEYIWIDGSKPTKKLRSKTKIFTHPRVHDSFMRVPVMQLGDFPAWGFDGSSTNQASGGSSDLHLKPAAVYRDPTRPGNAYLVLCEVYDHEWKPHRTNTRAKLRDALGYEAARAARPWIGFEQEYTMFKENAPLGWPICKWGRNAQPPPQGPYYCGVGADEAFGRQLVEDHLQACMEIGIGICGINAEVMPGQWEFQVGYRGDNAHLADPLHTSDDLWVARWLLYRIGEAYGITITLDVKPMPGDWNGAGCHTNFSTEQTRGEDGIRAINTACEKLQAKHAEHIAVYGHGLERRLTGLHETCDINTFAWGTADRTASIRIPRHVAEAGRGYLEDRRPGANCDPYMVSEALVRTVVL